MATVKIGNILSKWELSDQESEVLEKVTTAREKGFFHRPSYKFGAWNGFVTLFNKKNQTLPSGLVPDCVVALEDNNFSVQVLGEPSFDALERDGAGFRFDLDPDHQFRALSAMCANRTGIVHAATNSGKTKIAEAWCTLHALKILYLVPTKELLQQTLESFKKDTNLDVGYISATDGWKIGEDVTIALVTSIAKRKGYISNDKVPAFERFREIAHTFEAVIVDECHHLTADTWRQVLRVLTNAKYRYGLSGSPWADDDPVAQLRVKSYLGPVLCDIRNSELIEKGWSARPQVNLVPVKCLDLKKDFAFDEAYESGIVYNDLRNNIILKLVEKFNSENKSCLLISTRLAHCEILANLFKFKKIPYRVVTGATEKLDRKNFLSDFKNREFNVLISNVLSEGVDIPSLNCLIFVSGGKSSKQLLQKLGRGLRKKLTGDNTVEIYDFQDSCHSYLKNHFKQRLKLYKSENFETIETEITF